ncbi:MAG: ATP-dependent nuclease, partial [Sulfuricurvum sp.]
DKLRYPNTQIIYSTHSSHISEVSNIRNVNVLGKVDGKYEAFQPAAGLTNEQSGFVQRYLDAIRSNLLFAKSVILVEGDAEEILIPTLIKNVLGVSLDELGISLVNIRSTGFENIAMLFHDNRIRKKCSIITDLDEIFFDIVEVATDSDELKKAKKKARGSRDAGIARKTKLDSFCMGNQWIKTFYAPHTFEVDLIAAGNSKKFIKILNQVYTDAKTITASTSELESADIAIYGKRALTMAKHSGKGWFAIILGNSINSKTRIPDYIIEAVLFAHGHINSDVLSKIFNYRINKIIGNINKQERSNVDAIDLEANPEHSENVSLWIDYISTNRSNIVAFKQDLTSFRAGTLDLNQVRMNMHAYFPNDTINPILAKL